MIFIGYSQAKYTIKSAAYVLTSTNQNCVIVLPHLPSAMSNGVFDGRKIDKNAIVIISNCCKTFLLIYLMESKKENDILKADNVTSCEI